MSIYISTKCSFKRKKKNKNKTKTKQNKTKQKQKHRHIIQSDFSLLAQSHLSSKYWVEAAGIAVYLLNSLPTLTIQNSSPIIKLYNKELDYTFLKTFGCVCYPLLRHYIKHKLEFISK